MFAAKMIKNKFAVQCLSLLTLSVSCANLTFAQTANDFPNKPIRLVVAFAPGGSTDIAARILAQSLTSILKVSVFVENKPGAGASIGTQYVANAAADGYTYLVTSPSFIVNPLTMGANAGYSPDKDFMPVSIPATQPMGVVVNEKVPAKNLSELKELSLKKDLSYATAGNGTPPNLTCDNLFRQYWKSDVTHIPYKGSGPALIASVSGETPIFCGAVAGVSQFMKQGKVKVVAVSSDKRLPSMPEAPTFAEQGYPEIKDDLWVGVFAPVKTPKDILLKMNQAISQAIATKDVQDKLDQNDFITVGGSLEQTIESVQRDLIRWDKTVKSMKVAAPAK
jgi:tripartite-type tricarboxylate transporter receptor subunit TctC